jgi:hypothetical protein
VEEREETEKFGYHILATKTIKLVVIEFILKVNWRIKNKCFFLVSLAN